MIVKRDGDSSSATDSSSSSAMVIVAEVGVPTETRGLEVTVRVICTVSSPSYTVSLITATVRGSVRLYAGMTTDPGRVV